MQTCCDTQPKIRTETEESSVYFCGSTQVLKTTQRVCSKKTPNAAVHRKNTGWVFFFIAARRRRAVRYTYKEICASFWSSITSQDFCSLGPSKVKNLMLILEFCALLRLGKIRLMRKTACVQLVKWFTLSWEGTGSFWTSFTKHTSAVAFFLRRL